MPMSLDETVQEKVVVVLVGRYYDETEEQYFYTPVKVDDDGIIQTVDTE